MTITTTTARKEYTGDGSNQTFAYDFKIIQDSDLKVYVVTTATGASALKTITTHYTVTGAGSASGGNVVMGSAPTSSETLVITREVPFTQAVDYIENDAFPADTHESALDKLTMLTQQLQRDSARAMVLPVAAPDTVSATMPDPSVNDGKLLGIASDGLSIEATTGRVSTVTASTSTVGVSSGASQSATGSVTFNDETGALALALGLPVGNTGMMGGVSMQYSTTTADADPGAGFIRFNNTSLNSATLMYIDDSDGTNDITAWVATWDDSDSTVTGFLTIAGNPNSSSPLVIYKVTGLTDASGYTKINVTYVAGSTSISNNAEVSVSFSPSGNVAQAGLHFKWDSGTSDADPGAGEIAFNNGTVGSVTILYIDDVDQKSVTVSSFIQAWDESTDSGNKGYVKVTKRGTPSTYALYKVTGTVTNASGYSKVPVTHVVSNGTYTAGDDLDIHFTRTGNAAYSGLHFKFDTGTSNADPGAGELALNHGTPSSATVIFVDDADQNSVAVATFVQTWDDSTDANKGFVRIEKRGTSSTFALYKVNAAVTDESGWTQVPVAHVASNGSFSSGDDIDVSFTKTGDLGASAGIHLTYSTTTTDSDPGSGVIRFNNGTLASATIAYVDDADADGANIEALVLSWDDSTTTSLRGTITMRKRTNPSIFAIWNITGASTDASGYSKLALTYVTGTGSFTNSDGVALHFTRTGDQGSDASNVFKTISVSGQDDVVADSATDSLTIAAGEGMTITTTAASDTVTFAGEDSAASNKGVVIVAGTSPVSVGYSSGTATVAVSDASTSAKGIASFSSDNFAASSGAITIKSGGVDLTAEVTGTLPVNKGGTGAATHTTNNVLVGAGTSAVTSIAPSTSGNVLTSNGTVWTSATPSAGISEASAIGLIIALG